MRDPLHRRPPSTPRCTNRRDACTCPRSQCAPPSPHCPLGPQASPTRPCPLLWRAVQTASGCSPRRAAPAEREGRGRCCSRPALPARSRRGRRRRERSSASCPWVEGKECCYLFERSRSSADQEVWRQAGGTELLHRRLGGLRLLLATRHARQPEIPHHADDRNQTHVAENRIRTTHALHQLTNGLQKHHALDVSDGPSDLDQTHICHISIVVDGEMRHTLDPVLGITERGNTPLGSRSSHEG